MKRTRTQSWELLLPLAALLGMAALFNGCTMFQASLVGPDGEVIGYVKEGGGLLVNRKGGFDVKHEDLDEKNVLHIISVSRTTDENADNQLRAIEMAFEYGMKAGAAGAGIPVGGIPKIPMNLPPPR